MVCADDLLKEDEFLHYSITKTFSALGFTQVLIVPSHFLPLLHTAFSISNSRSVPLATTCTFTTKRVVQTNGCHCSLLSEL